MRINKFLAQVTGMSRRGADAAIVAGEVFIHNQPASAGQGVADQDIVTYHGHDYTLADVESRQPTTIILNKPAGYVVSRNGQGSATIYDILPSVYARLKPIGRLDKDSSGLLLLTDDGTLAHSLTHPSQRKIKRYQVALDKPLQPLHHQMISDHGLQLEDGLSKLQLDRLDSLDDAKEHSMPGTLWLVTMHEGRNRQIRRTFAALGYTVLQLHRTQFGPYLLDNLPSGRYRPSGIPS